ncbi:hypothetical protein J6590_036229 [Homalodisca vitripennis]|nr:hypothetical protein J6590_036229 [Homalodisca vitripennis]
MYVCGECKGKGSGGVRAVLTWLERAILYHVTFQWVPPAAIYTGVWLSVVRSYITMNKTLQLVFLVVALCCLVTALPAPGHGYGGGYGGGGGGGGGHGHGHATSYQHYVLHSYHPVKVHVGGGHGGGYGGGHGGGHY